MSCILTAQDQHPFVSMDMPTLLAQRAAARRDHPFIVWEPFQGEPASWTYAEFHNQAGRIAAGLLQRGVVAGDRVLMAHDVPPAHHDLLWGADPAPSPTGS